MSSPPITLKSPLLTAVGISLTVALGAMLGSADTAKIEDALTGQWFTRAYTETQRGHTVAIAALEQGIAGMTREIDFVAKQAGASIRRSEDQNSDRLARFDAEIAALRNRIAGIESARVASATDAPSASAGAMLGLRTTLNDLTLAHNSAVAAITRRLDRIEVKMGVATDVVASIARPRIKVARRTTARHRVLDHPPENAAWPGQTERSPTFNIKPINSQGAPLRLSRLPG